MNKTVILESTEPDEYDVVVGQVERHRRVAVLNTKGTLVLFAAVHRELQATRRERDRVCAGDGEEL